MTFELDEILVSAQIFMYGKKTLVRLVVDIVDKNAKKYSLVATVF